MGILTVLWEKWVEFRRDFYKITLAAMIAPLLYILVFGLGIQTMSHGQSYLNFLIPGVVALTTMNGSFNAIAQNLNVQRLYEKAFDQVIISPTPLWQFIAGQIIGGSLRGLYAGAVIILLILPIGTGLRFNGWSFLLMFLNGSVFSTIGVVVSFYCQKPCRCAALFELRDYADGISVQYIFSARSMPDGLRQVIEYLPLSQTSAALRSIANHEVFSYTTIGILLLYLACFSVAASWFLYKKKNL